MDDIPHYDNPSGELSVTVRLQKAADVYLVDQANFNHYQQGAGFKYYGGSATKSPVVIKASGSGRWYLIVDDHGAGSRYSYTWG
jgi:hypothetical protein